LSVFFGVVATALAIAAAGSGRAEIWFLVPAVVLGAWFATRRGAAHFAFVPIVFAAWFAAIGPWHGLWRYVVAVVATLAAFVLGARANRNAGVAVAVVIALSAVVPAWVPHTGTRPVRPNLARVDRYLREQVDHAQLPGVAVGVVQDGRIVFTQGYGVANDGKKMTERTPVVIGSTSKSITATAIVQLAAAGKIDLDASVGRYLPWYKPRDARALAITLRQLLIDTSGVPTWAGWSVLGGGGHANVRKLTNGLRLSKEPGRAFQYSNANYILLGQVIEAVNLEPYDSYLKHAIVDPLGLTNTAAREVARNANRFWFGQSLPSHLPYLEAGAPAGAVMSSARDLARYLVAHLTLEPALVADKDLFETMHLPAVKAEGFGVPGRREYAMGWYVSRIAGKYAVFHSGDVFDSSSSLVMLPHDDIGVVIVASTTNVFTPVSKTLAEGVAAVLVDESPPRLARPMAIATVAVTALGSAVFALAVVRARRLFRRRGGGVVRTVVVDIVVPVVVLLGLPYLFSRYLDRAETLGPVTFWRIIERAVPDAGLLVLAALLLRVIAGVYGLVPRRAVTTSDKPWNAIDASPAS
jgi:CubicO group peptidase (beta-lactamase class C family)